MNHDCENCSNKLYCITAELTLCEEAYLEEQEAENRAMAEDYQREQEERAEYERLMAEERYKQGGY